MRGIGLAGAQGLQPQLHKIAAHAIASLPFSGTLTQPPARSAADPVSADGGNCPPPAWAPDAAAVAVGTGVFMKKFSFGDEEKIRTGKKLIKGSLFSYGFILAIDLILSAIKSLIG